MNVQRLTESLEWDLWLELAGDAHFLHFGIFIIADFEGDWD